MRRITALAALVALPIAAAIAVSPEPAAKSPADDPTFQNKAPPSSATGGEQIFDQYCAKCHQGQVAKAPHRMFLQMMAPDAIQAAMDTGIMRAQAVGLTESQKAQVATWLGGEHAAPPLPAPTCTGKAAYFDTRQAPAASGWGITPENTRFIDGATAGLAAADVPKLKLKWAFAFPNAQRARSQPAVGYGAVYVGSQNGTVYALDSETGCVRWTFRATAEVRTAVVIEPPAAASTRHATPMVYFGDLIARVYALDAYTGQLRWVVKADDHPNATVTAAPVLRDGRLYVSVSSLEVTSAADPNYECCTFRGSLLALDAVTGATQWKSYTIPETPREVGRTKVGTRILAPSGAPVWNSAVVDVKRGALYVGTGENYSTPAGDTSDAILAFRMSDGQMLWHAQKTRGDAWNVACMLKDNPNCPPEDGPDFDFGAASMLFRRPGSPDLLLSGQKSGMVYGTDPDAHGRIVWSQRVGRGGIQGGVHFGMASDGEKLFVPISDMKDEHNGKTFTDPSRAGLYALDPTTGKFIWSTPADDVCGDRKFCDPGISASITAIPGVVFAGHMDGRLRGYDAATGKVVWEVDTTQPWKTVSGEVAHGGSFGGGAGPMVVGGTLYAASGYGIYFHMPGNVLLAFSPEGR